MIVPLLDGFATSPAAGEDSVDFELALERDDGESLTLFIGYHGSARRARFRLRGPEEVEYILVREAVKRSREYVVLHSAAVAAGGGACLILGPAGAGKTSLALHLRAAGLPLLTDDLSPFRRCSRQVEEFRRALHIDGDYTPELNASLPPVPPGYPWQYRPFPRRGESVPQPVERIIVLQPGRDATDTLVPLGKSEVAHHLLSAVIPTACFDFADCLRFASDLASESEAYLLCAGSELEARTAALDLLAPIGREGQPAAGG